MGVPWKQTLRQGLRAGRSVEREPRGQSEGGASGTRKGEKPPKDMSNSQLLRRRGLHPACLYEAVWYPPGDCPSRGQGDWAVCPGSRPFGALTPGTPALLEGQRSRLGRDPPMAAKVNLVNLGLQDHQPHLLPMLPVAPKPVPEGSTTSRLTHRSMLRPPQGESAHVRAGWTLDLPPQLRPGGERGLRGVGDVSLPLRCLDSKEAPRAWILVLEEQNQNQNLQTEHSSPGTGTSQQLCDLGLVP